MVHFDDVVVRDIVRDDIGGGNAKRSSLNGEMSDAIGGGGSKLTEYASSLPIYAL